MKKIVLFIALCSAFFSGQAQYFNTKSNAVLAYKQCAPDGTISSIYQYDNGATEKTDGCAITSQKITSSSFDDGKIEKGIESTSYIIDNGKESAQYFDMNSDISGFNLQLKGKAFVFPNKIKVGQKLDDFEQIMIGNIGAIEVSGIAHYKDRKVTGKEQVSVDAGSFDCFKINENIEINFNPSSGLDSCSAPTTQKYSRTLYVANGVGVVKIVTNTEKGDIDYIDSLTNIR